MLTIIVLFLYGDGANSKISIQPTVPSDFKETRSDRESRKDQYEVSNITTKGDMEGQQNPNEPGKSGNPGQQGGQQQDREKQERERQQREREKNKVAAVNRAVAANRVVSKADDKPGYLEKESGGRRLPPFFLSVHRYNHALPLYGVC